MPTSHFHIAEINVARLLAPLDDPLMADFVAQLDDVNATADASEGFVWRLKSDAGQPSSYVQAFDDDRMLINMSVWASIESLHQYVYRVHQHAEVFRARRNWFAPVPANLAMWWIEAGRVPSIEEGKERLEMIARLGPTAEAFTFKASFPPPALPAERHTSA